MVWQSPPIEKPRKKNKKSKKNTKNRERKAGKNALLSYCVFLWKGNRGFLSDFVLGYIRANKKIP